MVKKGIQPIAIIGTGYPLWVGELLYEYEVCRISLPSSIPKEGHGTISKIEHVVPPSISKLLSDAMAGSRQHFNPMIELKQIEYIKEVCTMYYYASAKGYLTKDEVVKIIRECPNLPIK